MRVALINQPYFNKHFMENIGIVEHHVRTLPPLSLMYVSSIVKKHGHECILVDAVAGHLPKRAVAKKLRRFRPDIIGFSCMVPVREPLFSWASYLRKKLSTPVVVGGHALRYYPEAIVSNECVDFGIVGSALEPLPALLTALEGRGELERIKGFAFKKNGKVIVNYPDTMEEDMDALPFPDREGLDHSPYTSVASSRSPYTVMVTSSGCRYQCDFCPMGRIPYRERKVAHVVEEIEECARIGIKEIDIFDEDFLMERERARHICEALIRKGIRISWSCRTRVTHVDRDILQIMHRAGCRMILYGIESGNDAILKREHKGITREQIVRAIELTRACGIEPLGFFIIGHEGETPETIRDTIRFSQELPLSHAQFFHMVVKPGTAVYDRLKKQMGHDYFDALLRGMAKEKDLPLEWTGLSTRDIRRWVLRAYFSFYFRKCHVRTILKLFVNQRWALKFRRHPAIPRGNEGV